MSGTDTHGIGTATTAEDQDSCIIYNNLGKMKKFKINLQRHRHLTHDSVIYTNATPSSQVSVPAAYSTQPTSILDL